MKHIAPIPALIIAVTLQTACHSVPSEVVGEAEVLRDHTLRMSEEYSESIELYHERIDDVNDRLTDVAIDSVRRYEQDVRLLQDRLQQVNDAYTQVSAALEDVLSAGPAKPREAMFRRDQAVDLTIALTQEKRRAARAEADLEAVSWRLRSIEELQEDRRDLARSHAQVQHANAELRDALEDRLETSETKIREAFSSHLEHMIALVREKAERRRLRARSRATTEDLSTDLAEPRAASPVTEHFEAFDAETLPAED
jgi:DNA repair exonuclease SbcCD ATPase subunit